ncbi:MAG: phospholipase D-like domain-containing protein [Myxococcaceae bacterium]
MTAIRPATRSTLPHRSAETTQAAVVHKPLPKTEWLGKVIDSAHTRLFFNLDTVSDPKLLQKLIAAHKRGVYVRISMTAGEATPSALKAQKLLEDHGIDVQVRTRPLLDSEGGVADGTAFSAKNRTLSADPGRVQSIAGKFDTEFQTVAPVKPTGLLPPGHVKLHEMPESHATAILNAIASAKSSVDLEVYQLSDRSVVDALKASAKSGVKVRVMLEPETVEAGNYKQMAAELAKAGITVKPTPPRFSAGAKVDHAKFMVIDGKEMLFGTGNLVRSGLGGNQNPQFNNRDFWVEDSRAESLKEAAALFEADWNRQPTTGIEFKNFVVTPDNSQKKLLDLINGASKRLYVYNQSLTDTETVNALLAAEKRGVQVEVLLGKQGDGSKNAPALKKLQAAGIVAGFYDRNYLHAKGIVADDKAFLGSQNFTNGGMENNREVGQIFTRHDVVEQLVKMFQDDLSHPHAVAA